MQCMLQRRQGQSGAIPKIESPRRVVPSGAVEVRAKSFALSKRPDDPADHLGEVAEMIARRSGAAGPSDPGCRWEPLGRVERVSIAMSAECVASNQNRKVLRSARAPGPRG